MKLIVAIIKPYKLEDVKEGLAELNLSGMVITEVKGIGRQKGHDELYRGSEYLIDFLPKVRLEVGVADELVAVVVKTIIEGAVTKKIGDGKVFVLPFEAGIDIGTDDDEEHPAPP